MKIISAEDASSGVIESEVMNAERIKNFSTQGVLTGTGKGTLKLVYSNEDDPENFHDVPTASVNITGAGSFVIAALAACYKWMKAVFTNTFVVINTITAISDDGVLEIDKLTFPALADLTTKDYIVFKDAAGLSYAVALDKVGGGVAPTGAIYTAIAAGRKTFIDVSAATTAEDVATAVRTALLALPGFTNIFTFAAVSGGDLPYTLKAFGAVGFVPTGHNALDSGAGSITGAATTPGHASRLNSTYFKAQGVETGVTYVFYMNIGGLGVDPALAGTTSVPVVAAASASANTMGAALRTAAGAIGDFTTTGANAQAILTNDVAGAVTVPLQDGAAPTGFTLAETVPTGTIDVFMQSNQ